MASPPPGPGGGASILRSPWLRVAGLLVGIVLLAAAVLAVWLHRETVAGAIAEIRHPSIPMVLLLMGAVAANLMLSGLLFSLLIGRYGRVGLLEMQGLIASTALLNYLPLRPGLFGRVAYHRACNGIRVADTVRTVLEAVGLSACIAAWLALVLSVSVPAGWPVWAGVALPVPIMLAATAGRASRLWAAALLVRYAELMVWSARYYAAFALLGVEIEPHVALACACISVIATMVPFVSNGLGLREWAIGLAAPLLSDQAMEVGITAELVNRAAEIVVVLVAGLIATPLLARHRLRAGN